MRAADVEFRLLGPVEAVRNGEAFSPGGPRQQALLALLLVQVGRSVPVDRLVEELWHGRPPPGAAGTLPTYVSRLRSALGAEVSISSGAGGYAVEALPEKIDAHRFERLAAAGHEALARGSAARAAELLCAALALWRGRPFGDLAEAGALRREADRLEQVRLLAVEDRVEAELALGRAAELVDELEALVREHPYRERLWRHLMLALYRAERQADALAAYRRAREILDEELGLEPGEELKQLEQAILRQEVPVQRPPEERHNLPASLTSFVGREEELAEIERRLAGTRLVTLTGVGGAGKTRLALEAARRVLPDFPDGVIFCDLSALADPELVEREVATALGVEHSATEPGELLAARLRRAELLIVLDNCEHLRAACAELAHTLLSTCPHLRVMATSRDLLGAPGEHDYPVPPLALPTAGAGPDELRSSEAVRLFLARARAARPGLGDDDATLAAAARICSDLDGLPLAIELAAARARALALEDIESRLRDRFRFLVSWRRLSVARHRTLREAMDWSWGLLAPEEQAVLARLSVFAGGFSLPAVAAVCTDADEERALESVERLADASLVVGEELGGKMRYRLLETVREYAGEHLAQMDEAEAARDRQAKYYLDLAELYSRAIYDRGTQALGELNPDDANLTAALLRFQETLASELELRLCAAAWRYWWLRGDVALGRSRIEAALERAKVDKTAARVEALRGASTLVLRQGDYATAASLAKESVDVARPLGEVPLARALVALGNALSSLGDLEQAGRLYTESADRFRRAGRKWELANALLNVADLAANRGDFEKAEEVAGESLLLNRTLGDNAGIAVNLGNLGFLAVERGHIGRAFELFEEALERAATMGFVEWTAIMLVGLAAVATAEGEDRSAAELVGTADRLLEEAGATLDSIEGRARGRTMETLRRRLGDEALASALEAGRGLSVDEAVALAGQVRLR